MIKKDTQDILRTLVCTHCPHCHEGVDILVVTKRNEIVATKVMKLEASKGKTFDKVLAPIVYGEAADYSHEALSSDNAPDRQESPDAK